MAEAAVESATQERFYCHQCTQEITPKLPDFTCPRCDGGFIEQMSEESPNHSPSADLDPAAQFAELWSRAFLDSFRNNTTDRNDSSGPWPQNRDSDEEETEESGENRRPFQVRFAPRTRIAFRRGGRQTPNRNPYLEGLVNYFISRLGVDPSGSGSGSPIGMFHLHGNPGDYAWGAGGLDQIISQLLNQLEGAGAPPAEKDKIDSLPTVTITQDQAEHNVQCSICMDDFKVDDEAKKLPCDHHYHPQCINKWLELHGTCPVCRKDLNGDTYKEDFPSSMNSDSSNSSDDFQNVH